MVAVTEFVFEAKLRLDKKNARLTAEVAIAATARATSIILLPGIAYLHRTAAKQRRRTDYFDPPVQPVMQLPVQPLSQLPSQPL